jgi:putative hydrolase of the HAD superfamily
LVTIRAVLFDLYETLVTERGLPIPRASALGGTLGVDGGAFRVAWRECRPLIVRGRLTFGDALTDIGAHLGVAIDSGLVRRVCRERVQAKRLVLQRIHPDVLAVIGNLRSRNIRLGVVSNCFPEDVEAWPGCALAPQFTTAVFSFTVGMAKPEPEIYVEAVRRLGVEPEAALFVGDGADEELTGARRAGLRAARAAWFVDA